MLYHQELPFVPEIIWIELISQYYDNPLAEYFSIDKTRELIGQKYYWPSLKKDVNAHVKGCNVCLALKTVRDKPYEYLQALPVPIHQWKDLSMDFVTGLLVSTNWKSKSYNSILVIVNQFTKMVYYELLKVIINAPGLAKVILEVIVWHYSFPNSIVSDKDLLFTFKFWSSLSYFLGIKQRLFTAFHP